MTISGETRQTISTCFLWVVILAISGCLYRSVTTCRNCLAPEEITERTANCKAAGLPATQIVNVSGKYAGKAIDIMCRDYERVKRDLNPP